MKDKKILFMGGKYVGFNCLKYLVLNEFSVVGCFVNEEDEAKNRWYDSLREFCVKQKIPVYYFPNVNSVESENKMRKLSPDIIVVVYYDQILKQNIIDLPKMGCINLHLALPQVHRGCYPTTWSLIRGDALTGATLHFITTDIDNGPVIAQRKIKIEDNWTGKDLYYKVSDVGIALFKEYFPKLEKIKPRKIDMSKALYYKKEFPSREIELDKKTYNKVRALIFEPFPPPYIKIGKRLFIIKESS